MRFLCRHFARADLLIAPAGRLAKRERVLLPPDREAAHRILSRPSVEAEALRWSLGAIDWPELWRLTHHQVVAAVAEALLSRRLCLVVRRLSAAGAPPGWSGSGGSASYTQAKQERQQERIEKQKLRTQDRPPTPAAPPAGGGAQPPAGGPAQPPAGAGGAGPPAALSDDCPSAPKTVTLPPAVSNEMQTSFANSFPGGASQERGGIIVRDAKGVIKVVNEATGTSGTFQPNRAVKAGETILGTYHTHPYDQSEGGHKGVSFSGADIAYADHFKEGMYVDAGDKQFLIMPTKATNTDAATIDSEWNAEFAKQLAAGKTIQEASSAATNAVARKHGMAYYEGANGTLRKVSC